jgi:hypothetical protein
VASVQGTYVIESATDLVPGEWKTLRTYTNRTGTPQTAIFEEPISGNEPQRYYRIRLSP